MPAQLFLSYAEEDNAYCDLLKTHLSEPIRQKTLALWSQYQIEAGRNVEGEISSHLEQAALILLLFSPDYLANDACYKQLQRAIQIGEQEPERVWIVLLRPCAWTEIRENIVRKEHFPFLPHSYRTISHWPIQDRDDVAQDIVGEITKFVERMQRVGRTGGSAKGPTTPLTPPEKLPNPYLALRSFGIEDEPSFYGREGPTREVLDKIESMLRTRNTHKEQRLLAIIGASGAGKSSLLHAGVLPRLIRGELADSETWIILRTLCPGDRPLDNLADVLCDHLPSEERRNVKDTLTGSPNGLGYLVNDITRHSQPRQKGQTSAGTNVVLVIDQFEECLTQSSWEECKTFVELLLAAATRRYVPLLILMTCRADFYQELMGYHAFFDLLRQHEVILNKPMTFSEMHAAIETPLHKVDSALQFETGLVDQIIADLQGQKEALPLLQFTLFELFERRQGFLLTRQAYQEIQGVDGALAKHAEDIYEDFQEQQAEVRNLFLSLVKVSMGEDQEFVAIRQRVDYEQSLPPDKPANSLARVKREKMINAFVNARLLTTNGQKIQRTLEISHEILLQAWPRLAEWVHENEEALYMKNRATQDARNWQRNNQPPKDLYAGQQLQGLNSLIKRDFIASDEPLRTFWRESQARQNRIYVTRISIVFIILLILTPLGYNALNYLLTLHQIQVTSAADDGPGSLRKALREANPGDTIVLNASKIGQTVITLQQDLNFAANDDNVTLKDNGVTLTAPTGQQIYIFPGISVTFNGLAIQKSGPAPHRAQGGVIFNQGVLTLVNCTISKNQSNYNGGALVNTGSLILDNTEFSQNTSTGYGGAIYNAGGSVSISNGSKITNNRARDGGGLYSIKGAVTIIDSFIENNIAGKPDGSRYFGGGLAFRNATLIMTHSTVQKNQVYGDGGGISLLDSSAKLNASTITSNTAFITSTSATPAWGGGGIAVDTSIAQNPSSQALIVNMSIPGTATKASDSGSISNNAIQPGGTSSQAANILGAQQIGLGSSSITASSGPVSIGYPSSQGSPPESLKNYVGNINLDLFCETKGYDQGVPTPDDLASIICVKATQETLQTAKYAAVDACKDQYHHIDTGHATTRLYDYYDLTTWECYQDVEPVPSFTEKNMADKLDQFCQAPSVNGKGLYTKNLSRTTAYDWQCENADGQPTGISMADACRNVTQNHNAFERLKNFNDLYGWECWIPLSVKA